MFDRKRKIGQYRFLYGKSPVLDNSFPKQGFRTPNIKPGKRPHPILNKIRRISTILGIFIVGGFIAYAILLSNYFTITDISLRNKEIENQNIAEKIKKTISGTIGKNIIFTDTTALESKILLSFPELEKVTLGKDYPNALLIEFSEYPLVANVVNESPTMKKSYILNAIGYVVKENYEDKKLPYIRVKSDEPVNPKNIVIESSKLSYILGAKSYFEDKFGMRIIEVVYKPTAREIHLLTEKNCYIWLDIQRPYEQQLKKLKKALVKLDIYKTDFQYIDLRITGSNGDKIIYKRR
ncbi:MAG: hypothetical protein WC285_00765 [Candidatus Gracilibacteria bacterium]|jgi:hypothetical protein